MIKALIDKTIDPETAAMLSRYLEVEVIDTSDAVRACKEKLGDANILCIRTNTIIDDEFLMNAPKLRIIATATTGTNHIDTESARNQGIHVIDAKGANADSVADYVFRMLFAVTDDAHYTNELLKKNPESFQRLKKENFRKELASYSFGIIGFGNIGRRVARRATAFGMDVLAYDPYVDDALNTLDEVLECDIVTIHAELTDETRGMIDAGKLSLMKDNVILINAARAEIVEEKAVIKILKERDKMHFITDVFYDEPKPSELYHLDNCTVTPHIAGNAREAKKRAARLIAEKIISLIRIPQEKKMLKLPIELPIVLNQ